VAGRVYRRLRPLAGTVSRVILAGPPHRAVATSSAAGFDTPLGVVPTVVNGRMETA
jgi:AmmeMemoRadiSam system protein B